jgi:Pyridoxamine 5'-phosphate oxidase
MGKIYQEIDERIRKWIGAQPVFFVSTAPLDPQGRINCSPKDGYSIRVLDSKTLVYLDLIGSGVETIAHIRENSRIIIMMCAFERAPLIMRFHGRGEIIEKDHADFEGLIPLFDTEIGIRSFIKIHLDRISDSCGFGVPVMEFKFHRKQLRTFNERNGEEKLADYKIQHNSQSIDGLPGVRTR